MSVLSGSSAVLGCGEDSSLLLQPYFSAYRTKRNSHSLDEGSSYDGDRPNSVKILFCYMFKSRESKVFI